QYSDFVSELTPGLKYMFFINDELLRTCQIMSFIKSWYAIFESLEVDGVFFIEIGMDFADIGRRGRRSLYVRNRRIFLTILFWLNSVFMIMSTRSSYALVKILCLLIQQNRAAVVKSWKYGEKLLSKDDNLSSFNAISTNIFSSAKSLASSPSLPEDVV